MSASAVGPPPVRRGVVAVALLVAFVLAAVALLWSKWLPYGEKAAGLASTHDYGGSSILTVGGVRPGDAPTWHAATSFASTYLASVWKALVAALVISAAVSSLVPTGWAARLMNRRGRLAGAAVGGLAATPSLMCTCCTAPVAVTLRRQGVQVAAVVAYWLGNPLLNPAVLVFLGFVAPWQWTVTRLVVGLAVVLFGSVVVARVAEGRQSVEPLPSPPPPDEVAGDAAWLAGAPARFARTVVRLAVVLVPEYAAVVLLIGAFRGWLFPVGSSGLAQSGLLLVVLAAVVGTLVVLPTGGEIPIVVGLAALGLSLGGVGALLLTLPAASLPAMAMLVRSLGWRAVAASAGVVAVGGVVAGGLLTVLG